MDDKNKSNTDWVKAQQRANMMKLPPTITAYASPIPDEPFIPSPPLIPWPYPQPPYPALPSPPAHTGEMETVWMRIGAIEQRLNGLEDQMRELVEKFKRRKRGG